MSAEYRFGPPTPAAGATIRLVWVLPDLLSAYGDQGNLLVLEHRAAVRGIRTTTSRPGLGDPIPPDADIYLIGGGEDRPQERAVGHLKRDGGLARAVERGAVILAVCAGYQMIGYSFGDATGRPVAGLGLLDISSGRGSERAVGELVASANPALMLPELTGFENHQGTTTLGPAASPLGAVEAGVGNGDTTEGAWQGHIIGTYLHGPVLVRNPALADLLLQWALGRQLPPLSDEWVERLRAERLAAVPHQRPKIQTRGRFPSVHHYP